GAYFFTALPAELLLRGGLQNGVAQALRGRMGAAAGWVALGAVAALTAPLGLARGGGTYRLVADLLISLAAGWVYLRTGKVTASAVTHMFIALTMMLLTTP
ncbi:CPBP family intramembrane metalloprotease, partial [Oscillochloris sp. ZM17-4]|uniref:CPBP family glutamic-type intramembrane protease n=1 Tax=Oscillochloris sp. ZM17-4 TaxID=2866714 RepID=UPI001C72A83E